jgi:predicted ribosome quality control (RQC) complex YloA/Tae2 family protein
VTTLREEKRQKPSQLPKLPTTGKILVACFKKRTLQPVPTLHRREAMCRLRAKVLIGASLAVPFDRVIRLDFGFRAGEPAELHLMCEIQGRYSNVILMDAAKTVLLASRQIGTKQSSARSLRVGDTYPLPPVAPGLTPSASESFLSWKETVCGAAVLMGDGADVVAGMVRGYQGVSPTLGRELCLVAHVPASTKAVSLLENEWAALFVAWRSWLQCLEEGSFQATRDPLTGAISVLGSFSEVYDSVHKTFDERYTKAQAHERFVSLRATLSRATGKAEKSIRSKLKAFEKQMGTSADAQATQKLGDLFIANLYQWPAQGGELEVDDWETGGLQPLCCDLLPLSIAGKVRTQLSWMQTGFTCWEQEGVMQARRLYSCSRTMQPDLSSTRRACSNALQSSGELPINWSRSWLLPTRSSSTFWTCRRA